MSTNLEHSKSSMPIVLHFCHQTRTKLCPLGFSPSHKAERILPSVSSMPAMHQDQHKSCLRSALESNLHVMSSSRMENQKYKIMGVGDKSKNKRSWPKQLIADIVLQSKSPSKSIASFVLHISFPPASLQSDSITLCSILASCLACRPSPNSPCLSTRSSVW